MADIVREATLRVVHQADLRYVVEVTIEDACPTIVSGFDGEADAEAWIVKYNNDMQAKIGRKYDRKRWARR
jgi:hypothetical protein